MAKILDFKANNTIATTPGELTNVIGSPWNVSRDSVAYTPVTSTTLSKVLADVARVTSSEMFIEPIGTNLLLHSNLLSDVIWTKSGTGIANGTDTAPDGSTVEKFELNDGLAYQDVSFANENASRTLSLWIKADKNTTIGIRPPNAGDPTEDFSITTSWQRVEKTSLYTSASARVLIDNRSGSGYGSETSLLVSIFSAQIENSTAVASSEIVSEATQYIRLADVITNTVPAGTAPITMTTWIDGVSDGGVAVNQGDPITMLNGTTSIEIDDSASGATTTVEIEWIDSISAAATGNKIYRDDVEIADVANGIQFYSDPTAPAGTESKYEVQAHDGAGDETTQEVEGDNMDYITTAS